MSSKIEKTVGIETLIREMEEWLDNAIFSKDRWTNEWMDTNEDIDPVNARINRDIMNQSYGRELAYGYVVKFLKEMLDD